LSLVAAASYSGVDLSERTPARTPNIIPLPEATMAEWVRPLIVEFIGTFALIFMGAGAIIVTGGHDLVAIAFAHGLAIGLNIAAGGHISGGLFNPAVTLGLVIGQKLDWLKGVAYAVIQCVGATVAALCLYWLLPAEARDPVNLGTPGVSGSITSVQAMGIELVLTFFLMYVIYGVAVDKRGPAMIAPLAIGLTITMDIFAMGGATGAAMNPARFLGPAIVSNTFDDEWVYWVGPGLGAALAAIVYAYILIPPLQEPPAAEPDRLAQP
jgi:aquaporin TIP